MHIELTNVCNAACPICPRYTASSRLERPGLVHTSISYEQYTQWFTPEFLANQCGRIMLCGNQGDPVAAPDIVRIVEYTLEHLPKDVSFVIHSNGGLRNEKTWNRLGELIQGSEHWFMYFSIDGLSDTNHLYRRNVNWNKLMQNASAFIESGGRAYWDLLVFKHNEHQVEDIKKLASDMGFLGTRVKLPDGFYWNGEIHTRGLYDREGQLEYTITASDIPEYQNAPANTPRSSVQPAQQVRLTGLTFSRADEEYNRYQDHNIQCKSLSSDYTGAELFVAQDGLVLPCCFIGELWQSGRRDAAYIQLEQMFDTDYMNLKNNSLKTIAGYFDSLMIPSWRKDNYSCGKTRMCSKTCGSNSNITRLIYDESKHNEI